MSTARSDQLVELEEAFEEGRAGAVPPLGALRVYEAGTGGDVLSRLVALVLEQSSGFPWRNRHARLASQWWQLCERLQLSSTEGAWLLGFCFDAEPARFRETAEAVLLQEVP